MFARIHAHVLAGVNLDFRDVVIRSPRLAVDGERRLFQSVKELSSVVGVDAGFGDTHVRVRDTEFIQDTDELGVYLACLGTADVVAAAEYKRVVRLLDEHPPF